MRNEKKTKTFSARPCSTRNAMTATLKLTRCGRPWVDAANVELQGRPRHDRNDLGETPDEPLR